MHSKDDPNNNSALRGVDQQIDADWLEAVSSEHNSIGILAAWMVEGDAEEASARPGQSLLRVLV